MNFYGVVIAVITFMIIGVFHPIVIKAEYHLTERCWPLFLAAGIVLIGGSVLVSNTMLSCVLGVTGCSCMWSIKELREQKERVRKGWFPANPARNGDAKRQDAGRSGCDGTSSCSEGMAEEYADNAVNCRNDNEKKGSKIMEMRRKEKMISQEEIMEVLETAEYGVLSTVSGDGIPYGTPVNFVFMDGAIYFHCATEGHRLDNIAANDNVCFTVVDSVELMPEQFNTRYRSVIAFGKAEVLENEEEKKAALLGIVKKLSPGFIESGMKYIDSSVNKAHVIRICVSEMTGKATR